MTHPAHKKPPARVLTRLFGGFLAVAVLSGLLLACDKKDDPAGDDLVDDVPPPVEESMFNKVIRVNNLGDALPADHKPMDKTVPFYYSLENQVSVNTKYKQTARWDISFSGTYRSFIGGNNAADNKNFGYKGPGKGGILILEKAFDDVVDIPSDEKFRTGSGLIGTDESGVFGEGIGYYCYDFGGNLFNDGSDDYKHIAYVLADTVVKNKGKKDEAKILPRTLVVKTARGNYAKIKMMSMYKDLTDPKDWRRNSPHPYYTFEYVLAKAGSTKFELNNND